MRYNRIALLFLIFPFLFPRAAHALDLRNAKSYFLNGDYAASIKECEKILAQTSYSPEMDSVYYILGLSYLKEGNYLRAEDIFEIVIKEFPASTFVPDAFLSWEIAHSCAAIIPKPEHVIKTFLRSRRIVKSGHKRIFALVNARRKKEIPKMRKCILAGSLMNSLILLPKTWEKTTYSSSINYTTVFR